MQPQRVEKSSQMLDAALKLKKAVMDRGINPPHHIVVERRHRKEWPALWVAIDELLEVIDG